MRYKAAVLVYCIAMLAMITPADVRVNEVGSQDHDKEIAFAYQVQDFAATLPKPFEALVDKTLLALVRPIALEFRTT